MCAWRYPVSLLRGSSLHLKECEWRWKKPQEQMNKERCKLLVKYGKQGFPHFNYLNDKSEN